MYVGTAKGSDDSDVAVRQSQWQKTSRSTIATTCSEFGGRQMNGSVYYSLMKEQIFADEYLALSQKA